MRVRQKCALTGKVIWVCQEDECSGNENSTFKQEKDYQKHRRVEHQMKALIAFKSSIENAPKGNGGYSMLFVRSEVDRKYTCLCDAKFSDSAVFNAHARQYTLEEHAVRTPGLRINSKLPEEYDAIPPGYDIRRTQRRNLTRNSRENSAASDSLPVLTEANPPSAFKNRVSKARPSNLEASSFPTARANSLPHGRAAVIAARDSEILPLVDSTSRTPIHSTFTESMNTASVFPEYTGIPQSPQMTNDEFVETLDWLNRQMQDIPVEHNKQIRGEVESGAITANTGTNLDSSIPAALNMGMTNMPSSFDGYNTQAFNESDYNRVELAGNLDQFSPLSFLITGKIEPQFNNGNHFGGHGNINNGNLFGGPEVNFNSWDPNLGALGAQW